MAKLKLLLDTNILVDYLHRRTPFYQPARLLMMIGYVGDAELWISSSQATDLIYILSDGGKAKEMPRVLKTLRGIRQFVNVYATGEAEIDKALLTSWADPEDALLYEIALSLKVDAIVSRNASDFEENIIPVVAGDELLDELARRGIVYEGLLC